MYFWANMPCLIAKWRRFASHQSLYYQCYNARLLVTKIIFTSSINVDRKCPIQHGNYMYSLGSYRLYRVEPHAMLKTWCNSISTLVFWISFLNVSNVAVVFWESWSPRQRWAYLPLIYKEGNNYSEHTILYLTGEKIEVRFPLLAEASLEAPLFSQPTGEQVR